MPKGRKDPVKKNMDILHKPRIFRDRKKESKNSPVLEAVYHHPRHAPYDRPSKQKWLQEYADELSNEPTDQPDGIDFTWWSDDQLLNYWHSHKWEDLDEDNIEHLRYEINKRFNREEPRQDEDGEGA